MYILHSQSNFVMHPGRLRFARHITKLGKSLAGRANKQIKQLKGCDVGSPGENKKFRVLLTKRIPKIRMERSVKRRIGFNTESGQALL